MAAPLTARILSHELNILCKLFATLITGNTEIFEFQMIH